MNIYLIMYDITANNLRNKIAKRLIAEGYERIQLSVFAGNFSPVANKNLIADLTEWMSAEPEARLFIIPVLKRNFKQMQIIGKNTLNIDYITGDQNTFFV